ncbi:MAG TPA: hypothetical protein VF077_12855 [Nitrospiraceae bacterium]
MNPLLVTMHGENSLDVGSLSNFEAGLAFLTLVDKMAPGITWGQLDDLARGYGAGDRLAGWWTDLKHSVGDVKDGIGDVLKDTVSVVGGIGGDTVRLGTDPKVLSGVSQLGMAYATGGGSAGVSGLLQSLGMSAGSANQVTDFISGLGDNFKSQNQLQAAGMGGGGGAMGGALPWIIAGGVIVVLLVATRK